MGCLHMGFGCLEGKGVGRVQDHMGWSRRWMEENLKHLADLCSFVIAGGV